MSATEAEKRSSIPSPIREYLESDRVINGDLIEVLSFRDGQIAAGSARGVLVSDDAKTFFMLSATDREYGLTLLNLIPMSVEIIEVCQEFMVEPALERFGFNGVMPCQRVAYLKETPCAYTPTLDVKRATRDLVPILSDAYELHDTADIREIVERGDLWCGFKGDQLIGFIGRHPEGAMGMLHVFEAHRRQGFGAELEMFLTNHILSLGQLPRGDVIVGNESSLALQKKIGFSVASTLIHWLYHTET